MKPEAVLPTGTHRSAPSDGMVARTNPLTLGQDGTPSRSTSGTRPSIEIRRTVLDNGPVGYVP